MNKQNKAVIGLCIIVVLAVAGFGVSAYMGTADTVMENVNIETYNEAPGGGENMGSMTSPYFETPIISHNGEKQWIIKGDCKDADVDIVSFANPFDSTASTTVVDAVRIRIDGVATSSGIITCGAATAAEGTPTYDLMTTGAIGTSTHLGCIMENGLLTADNGDSACPDGGSVQKISLGKTHNYFTCEISENGTGNGTAGFTNANNTFDCDYMVRLKQMR